MSKQRIITFEEFFAYNNAEIGNNFINAMNLPKDTSNLLKLYYIDKKKQKEIAEILNCEERTVRIRLKSAINLCKIKFIGWISNIFSKNTMIFDT